MFSPIRSELNAVLTRIEEDFQVKAGHLMRFLADFRLNRTDICLRPALVLVPAKIHGGPREKAVVLATTVQLIFLAQVIHNRVPDDCPKELPQFPVLVGDYLFSKFFKNLTDHDLLEWLVPLAQVICAMNEGGMIRREVLDGGKGSPADYLAVARKEHGLLTAQACRMGAAVSGAGEETLAAWEQFGLNLGLAWGLIKEKTPLDPGGFLDRAEDDLAPIPSGPEREVLSTLIGRMRQRIRQNGSESLQRSR